MVILAEESSYAKKSRELVIKNEDYRQKDREWAQRIRKSRESQAAQEKQRKETEERINAVIHKAEQREEKRFHDDFFQR